MLVGLQEGLLHYVFGIFAVLGDVLRQPEYALFVAAYQRFKRANVASLRRIHQRAFIIGWSGNGCECAGLRGIRWHEAQIVWDVRISRTVILDIRGQIKSWIAAVRGRKIDSAPWKASVNYPTNQGFTKKFLTQSWALRFYGLQHPPIVKRRLRWRQAVKSNSKPLSALAVVLAFAALWAYPQTAHA